MRAGPTPNRQQGVGGIRERLAELDARRIGAGPLDPTELAVVAELIVLLTGLLAREAASGHLRLPGEAISGAQALRAWAHDLADLQGQQPASPPGDSNHA